MVQKRKSWGDWRSYQILTKSEYDTYRKAGTKTSGNSYSTTSATLNPYHEREPCMAISMKPAKVQDEFFDMRFCGKRNGMSFANAVRPVKGKGPNPSYKCPTNTVACSSETSNDHTICIKSSDKASKCPITLAKFVLDSGASAYKNDAAYKVQDVDGEWVFVTSQFKGDNLPIVNYHVGEKPCLDSRDTAPTHGQKFYPLENDINKFNTCRTIKQFNKSEDSRYVTTQGVEISEYDVQEESKVWDKIKKLPHYEDFVSKVDKKQTLYKFWQRSNIDWDITCEAKHPRKQVMAAAQAQKNQKSLNGGGVMFLVITAFVLGLIISTVVAGMSLAGKVVQNLTVGSVCCLSCQVIFFLIAWIMVSG